jgi:PAS domain S-box-containing protein
MAIDELLGRSLGDVRRPTKSSGGRGYRNGASRDELRVLPEEQTGARLPLSGREADMVAAASGGWRPPFDPSSRRRWRRTRRVASPGRAIGSAPRWFNGVGMAERGIGSYRPRRRRWSAGDVQEALVISGEVALWLADGDDRIAYVNDAAVRILGFDSDEELLGGPSHDSIHYKHPDGSPYPVADCPITRATERGEPIRIERDWWVRKDGSLVPISIHCVPLEIDGRMGTAMTFHDLTGSVQAEDERRQLEVAQARLGEVRASRARIVAAADETRRRIERDLRDGIQRRLVALALQVGAAQTMVPAQLPELDDELSRIAEGLKTLLEELQEISHGIHPAVLSEGGLEAALEALARRSAVPVQLDLRGDLRLPRHVEVGTYYVVSEALTNVIKHAHATVVMIELETHHSTMRLAIRDDGIGGADPSQGSGLVGLSDRVEALGGTLTVTSPAGSGTTLRIEIPLDSQSGAGLPEP